jgi:propanediol utilization protein
MHIDTDEANAADLHTGTMGTIIKQPTLVKPEPDD